MTVHRGVRFRKDVGWEMRCDGCAISKGSRYWPLDVEFWDRSRGLSRCRACWNVYERVRRKRGDLATRSAALRTYQREWAARNRAAKRAAEGREKHERKAA